MNDSQTQELSTVYTTNTAPAKSSTRYLIAACSVILVLNGCSGIRDKTPVAIYDFGSPAQNIKGVSGDTPPLHLVLDVVAAPWLDGPWIDYRLAYADPLKRSQYTDSRWAAAPALLLAAQLRRKIGFVDVNVAAECVLRVELQEFSQVFSTPQVSRGVSQGQVSLIDGKRRLIASRAFSIERPAHQSDAAGGVQALVETGDELSRQLDAWLIQLNQKGELKNCGSKLP